MTDDRYDRLEQSIELAHPELMHCACLLVLDCSGSMAGEKIKALNDGLRLFRAELDSDPDARKRVDIAVVAFGEAVQTTEFQTAEHFIPPLMIADGATPLGDALNKAMDLLEERKATYRRNGTDYLRPWIFLITDGEPTDMKRGDALWNQVCNRVHRGEREGKFSFFAVAVESANLNILSQIAPPSRTPLQLRGYSFQKMFLWLSRSQQRVSTSRSGQQLALEAPSSWANIPV
jgi:uncharacterized protein YegL